MEAATEDSKQGKSSAKGVIVLSRLPFLSPGLAALVTGILIATGEGYAPDLGLISMSIIGLALIMLATYYFNEFYDYEGDIINRTFTKFSGGSRALPDDMLPRGAARIAGWSSVGILVAICIAYLVFFFEDYPLLLPLALFGAFCGVFYSHPPFQWAYKGIGEIMIGGCYGVLSLVSGYYVASGVLEPGMVLVAIPASLGVFGVIVANEFPDYEADKAVKKLTLIVRLGPKRGGVMFAAAMAAIYPIMLMSILVGIDPTIAIFGLPVLAFSAGAVALTVKGAYERPELQEKMAILTLLANLTASLLFVPAVYLS